MLVERSNSDHKFLLIPTANVAF